MIVRRHLATPCTEGDRHLLEHVEEATLAREDGARRSASRRLGAGRCATGAAKAAENEHHHMRRRVLGLGLCAGGPTPWNSSPSSPFPCLRLAQVCDYLSRIASRMTALDA